MIPRNVSPYNFANRLSAIADATKGHLFALDCSRLSLPYITLEEAKTFLKEANGFLRVRKEPLLAIAHVHKDEVHIVCAPYKRFIQYGAKLLIHELFHDVIDGGDLANTLNEIALYVEKYTEN